MNVLTPRRPDSTRALDLAAAACTPVDEVFARLASSETGLSGPDAAARPKTYGPNVLPARPVTAIEILLGQVRNPLLAELSQYRRLAALPFDHERHLASVLVGTDDGATTLVTKGAPEAVLARCVDTPGASAAHQDRPQSSPPTHTERHHRHIRRRAARCASHGAVAA